MVEHFLSAHSKRIGHFYLKLRYVLKCRCCILTTHLHLNISILKRVKLFMMLIYNFYHKVFYPKILLFQAILVVQI